MTKTDTFPAAFTVLTNGFEVILLSALMAIVLDHNGLFQHVPPFAMAPNNQAGVCLILMAVDFSL